MRRFFCFGYVTSRHRLVVVEDRAQQICFLHHTNRTYHSSNNKNNNVDGHNNGNTANNTWKSGGKPPREIARTISTYNNNNNNNNSVTSSPPNTSSTDVDFNTLRHRTLQSLRDDHAIGPRERIEAYMLGTEETLYPSWLATLPSAVRSSILSIDDLDMSDGDMTMRGHLARLPMKKRISEFERMRAAWSFRDSIEDRAGLLQRDQVYRGQQARVIEEMARRRRQQATRRRMQGKPAKVVADPKRSADYSFRLAKAAQRVVAGHATMGQWPLVPNDKKPAHHTAATATAVGDLDLSAIVGKRRQRGDAEQSLRRYGSPTADNEWGNDGTYGDGERDDYSYHHER
eukprot:PhM_4_TR9931/c0_g1_i1/m.5927